MTVYLCPAVHRSPLVPNGFSMPEALVVTAILCTISAIALPTFISSYESCCINAAVADITGMIREAKQNALVNEIYYAIGFDPVAGKISLISGKGRDGRWGTADDTVVRSFRLAEKGGGLTFGYGRYKPLPNCAAAPDGVSFQNNNTLICNPEMTGTAGVAYLITRSGSAIAIKMNSTDYGYTLWRWDGRKWARI